MTLKPDITLIRHADIISVATMDLKVIIPNT